MKYDVFVARNGAEALDLFIKKPFEIVFTALKMPGMDGLTLSLQVKATALNTPVVLILDEHAENIMNRIKAGRIDCVMFKPLRSGEIQKTLQYFFNCLWFHDIVQHKMCQKGGGEAIGTFFEAMPDEFPKIGRKNFD